jgi:tRNA threonylcarbamoyladenosine biosynthesis protein TsaE
MKQEKLELDISEPEATISAAAALLDFGGEAHIFLFEAPMGAGKTTLIKAMCKHLGSSDHFSSPTYSIVNEYAFPGGKIYHFDLYRLKQVEELLDLGIEELLDSGAYCFIEWPELAASLISAEHIRVSISSDQTRRLLDASRIKDQG